VRVVQDFARISLLLHMSHVIKGAKLDNIYAIITTALMGEGIIFKEEIGEKVVSCRFVKTSIFQSNKNGLATTLQIILRFF